MRETPFVKRIFYIYQNNKLLILKEIFQNVIEFF